MSRSFRLGRPFAHLAQEQFDGYPSAADDRLPGWIRLARHEHFFPSGDAVGEGAQPVLEFRTFS
jgi:hypothetical protein